LERTSLKDQPKSEKLGFVSKEVTMSVSQKYCN